MLTVGFWTTRPNEKEMNTCALTLEKVPWLTAACTPVLGIESRFHDLKPIVQPKRTNL